MRKCIAGGWDTLNKTWSSLEKLVLSSLKGGFVHG
jgi:hypothetical protein